MLILHICFLLVFIKNLPSSYQAPVSAGGSSKEPSNAQKDEGVFKAPPPPPKVTKCVTLPTDLYQDAVTALKCRKEHKEVHGNFSVILKLYDSTWTFCFMSSPLPLSLWLSTNYQNNRKNCINYVNCVFQLYTVVQHVKHFNDVVEFGENQEFTDDFEYLATGLKSGQPLNTRCLR